MVTGTRRYYSIAIPSLVFKDFRGEVKLQATTVATDSPIFYGLWCYLIR